MNLYYLNCNLNELDLDQSNGSDRVLACHPERTIFRTRDNA